MTDAADIMRTDIPAAVAQKRETVEPLSETFCGKIVLPQNVYLPVRQLTSGTAFSCMTDS